ncbi:MAG: hypothetical protein ACK40H_00205, partial [Sphingomonadaceae bacterium]
MLKLLVTGMAGILSWHMVCMSFKVDAIARLRGGRRDMRLLPLIAATALTATLVAAAPAQATGVFTIDFEDQTPLTFVSNPLVYPEATFTSGRGGLFISTTNTNGLCPIDGRECSASLTVDFLPSPTYY